MLAFITSMRHPDNAEDYAYNEKLLQQTLDSIALQTSDDYVVLIVGNRAPSFELPPRVEFVTVDFAPPQRVHGPHANRDGFVRDKGTKIGIGLIAARKYHPDWVMIFDADDFVHRSLVNFIESEPGRDGWVIDKGWIYSRARNGYRAQDDFHRTCGTSYVIPYSAYGVPSDLDEGASQEELIDAYGETLPNIIGAHRNASQWHLERGRKLQPIPFRAVVYQVDTGENHSGKALSGIVRPWNRDLDDTFGVPSVRGRLATAVACRGPVAVSQTLRGSVRRLLRPLRAWVGRILRREGRE